MNVNNLAQYLGDACYVFLAANFMWGLYNIILAYRRVGQLDFRSPADQAALLSDVTQRIQGSDYDSAIEMTADDPRALAQLTQVAIVNRKLNQESLRNLIAEVVQRDIIADLEHRNAWIATVIKSGPLLGLFGTVLGMMAAFGRIGSGEKVQPAQIADEISIALICTAMGLATAIPFNFLLAGLNTRIHRLQDGLSAGLTRVLDALMGTVRK